MAKRRVSSLLQVLLLITLALVIGQFFLVPFLFRNMETEDPPSIIELSERNKDVPSTIELGKQNKKLGVENAQLKAKLTKNLASTKELEKQNKKLEDENARFQKELEKFKLSEPHKPLANKTASNPKNQHGIARGAAAVVHGAAHATKIRNISTPANHSSALEMNSFGSFLSLETSTADKRLWLYEALSSQHSHTNEEVFSTVEYLACCGLGHRVVRMAKAAYVANLLKAALYGDWGKCDDIDVFEYLFGNGPIFRNQSATEGDINDERYHLSFVNDVPRCYGLKEKYSDDKYCSLTGPTGPGKIKSDYIFYSKLMERYQKQDRVESFVKQHFHGRTAIGMHIRAGNGEKGDFAEKKRQISDMNKYVLSKSKHIRELAASFTDPAVLFIATDTPSYISAFREELADTMPVVELAQVRAAEGEGVFFGQRTLEDGKKCLQGWDAAVQDMMILASTDVVIMPRLSSFIGLPLSVVLSRPKQKVEAPWCEVLRNKNELRCYDSVHQWESVSHPYP